MTIELICIGKLKEDYLRAAAAEYTKRLGRFCKLAVSELPETRLREAAASAEERSVVISESEAIIKRLEKMNLDYLIVLDIKGESMNSEAFAERLGRLPLAGKSRVAFVIGGSLGLSEDLLARADLRLSFSDLTFPHQLIRVMLLEQLYRAFKINSGGKYHK